MFSLDGFVNVERTDADANLVVFDYNYHGAHPIRWLCDWSNVTVFHHYIQFCLDFSSKSVRLVSWAVNYWRH